LFTGITSQQNDARATLGKKLSCLSTPLSARDLNLIASFYLQIFKPSNMENRRRMSWFRGVESVSEDLYAEASELIKRWLIQAGLQIPVACCVDILGRRFVPCWSGGVQCVASCPRTPSLSQHNLHSPTCSDVRIGCPMSARFGVVGRGSQHFQRQRDAPLS